jgi:hypothetical protein
VIGEIEGTNRVGEEDGPAVANELVEGDGTVRGLSLEVRGSRAETETVGVSEDVSIWFSRTQALW